MSVVLVGGGKHTAWSTFAKALPKGCTVWILSLAQSRRQGVLDARINLARVGVVCRVTAWERLPPNIMTPPDSLGGDPRFYVALLQSSESFANMSRLLHTVLARGGVIGATSAAARALGTQMDGVKGIALVPECISVHGQMSLLCSPVAQPFRRNKRTLVLKTGEMAVFSSECHLSPVVKTCAPHSCSSTCTACSRHG